MMKFQKISQANAGLAEIVETVAGVAGVAGASVMRRRAFAVLSELIKNKTK